MGNVFASGVYSNWDGVSNVSQFMSPTGQFCIAFDNGSTVTVVKTANGNLTNERVTLQKQGALFGAVTCDMDGNYYLATGTANSGSDTSRNTIFISKYDKNGNHIRTVGNNGSSSLAWYYDSSFYTKVPFEAGNCSISVNGDVVTVNYGRTMYSGHQSNSVFSLNTDTMTYVNQGSVYNSHSFAQRTIPFGDGFVYASEGDAYPRAFSVNAVELKDNVATYTNYGEIFHFWIEQGSSSDMYVVNDNFAHMGGLASANDKTVALVGTSVQSMNSNAEYEVENLFIQVFNPYGDLKSPSAYTTSGTRFGLTGIEGTTYATDYGVKWLTSYTTGSISNPQVVATDTGKIVVLYEYYKASGSYAGLYYIVLDENGNVIKNASLLSASALLNPCTMPVYTKDGICWAANSKNDSSSVYVYNLKITY